MPGACKEFLDELTLLNNDYEASLTTLSEVYHTKGREAYDDACHLEFFEYSKKVYSLREKYGYPNKSEPKLKMR
ncbi:MAG: hypothetical protein RR273_01590 [Oscillospiraceae bacterium]